MSNVIQFPTRDSLLAEEAAANLVDQMSDLLSEWPISSILLSLYEAASRKNDTDAIKALWPAITPIIVSEGLTDEEREV